MIRVDDDVVEIYGDATTLIDEWITITSDLHRTLSAKLGKADTNALFVKALFASTVDAAMDEQEDGVE